MNKVVIYQALTRLWGKGKFSSWDTKTLEYLKSLGVDYLYLVGIPRHASGEDFVKGDPGCPYSICDWYDTNPYLASKSEDRMKEFNLLTRRVHKAGLKLMIDYIPNHVAKNYRGDIKHFDYCDGDWTDTLKNDWGSEKTRRAMVDILKFWASLGVDGFRCDMVELVPCGELGSVLREVKEEFPDLLYVAEVYGLDNYWRYISDGAFDLLYDKSGLYDSLVAISKGTASARSITYNWQRLGGIQSNMLCFLENHDEMRSIPLFGAYVRPSAAVSALFNNSSFMLYFGQEVGEEAAESSNSRTSIFSWTRPCGISELWNFVHGRGELSSSRAVYFDFYRKILSLSKLPEFNAENWDLVYCNEGTLDPDRQFAFVRYGGGSAYALLCNFSSQPVSLCLNIPSELHAVCGASKVQIEAAAFDFAYLKLF